MTVTVTAIALSFLAAQTVTRPATSPPSPPIVEAEPIASITPDVVVRGQSSQVVVKGPDAAILKTIGLESANGVRIARVQPLPPPKEGGAAVWVTIAVEANAAPGPRDLTVVEPSQGRGATVVRPGLPPELARDLEKLDAGQMTVTAGTIHVNTHAITVSAAEMTGSGAERGVRVTVVDKDGDIPPEPEDALYLKRRCDDVEVIGTPFSSVKNERQGSTIVLTAEFDRAALEAMTGCALHVRAKDTAGNMSPWFELKAGR